MSRFGAEPLSMGSVLERPDAEEPPAQRAAGALKCDMCAGYAGERLGHGQQRRVLVFGLEFKRRGQLGRGRHAKRIRLCDPCWGRLAA